VSKNFVAHCWLGVTNAGFLASPSSLYSSQFNQHCMSKPSSVCFMLLLICRSTCMHTHACIDAQLLSSGLTCFYSRVTPDFAAWVPRREHLGTIEAFQIVIDDNNTTIWNVYDMIWIRYDEPYLHAPKSWRIATLICRMEPNKKKSNEETKNKKPRCWKEMVQ